MAHLPSAFVSPIPLLPSHRVSTLSSLRPNLHQTRFPIPCMIINTPESSTQPIAQPDLQSSPSFPPTFAEKASGEWFGHEVSFSTRTGQPLNIPERYVPDAFRDWGVEIKGFDSVTSTKVTQQMYQKRTRALPTVGCEADAIIPEVAETDLKQVFAFDDGSYCVRSGSGKDEWMFAVVNPTNGRSRVRVDFGRVDEKIGKVTVLFENWESKFNEGQVLPGCGGEQGFAEEQTMSVSQLEGTWKYSETAYQVKNGWEVVESVGTVNREAVAVSMVLPKGVSVDVKDEGGLKVEVGWLVADKRVVIRRVYGEGGLEVVSRIMETQ